VDWRPRSGLALHAAYSWTDPRFRAGSDDPGSRVFCGLSNTVSSSTFCVIGSSRGGPASIGILVPWVDGNVPGRTPRHMWNLGLDLRTGVGDNGSVWWARFDLGHQDDVFDRSIDGASYGARTLLGMRFGYERGPWSLQLWGSNLTNARYIRSVAARGATYYPTSPRPLDLIAGDGRRVGMNLRYGR
jgi:outer membrane receptor protein involved in Fe transport